MATAGYLDDPTPAKDYGLPQTGTPYLPESFGELSPEAKEEVLNYINYIMVNLVRRRAMTRVDSNLLSVPIGELRGDQDRVA